MKYISTKDTKHKVTFREAVLTGLAPNGGLFMPEAITPLPAEFYANLQDMTKEAIAMEVLKPFIGDEIDEKSLLRIVTETLDFDFPVVNIHDNIHALELFHGPTLAFKDVGARFMARCFSHFLAVHSDENTTDFCGAILAPMSCRRLCGIESIFEML